MDDMNGQYDPQERRDLPGASSSAPETPQPQRVLVELATPVEVKPPKKTRSRLGCVIWCVAVLCFVLLFFGIVGAIAQRFVDVAGPDPVLMDQYVEGDMTAKNRIAIVPLSGPIFDMGGFHVGAVEVVTAGLKKAEKDPKVRAVILEVNSPGGGMTASDLLLRRVKSLQDSGKKVVVLMKDVAASGGYYVSAGADMIVAHPTTITGSVGVIVAALHYGEGLARIGIKEVVYKSGEMKDLLSPMRDASPQEQALLDEVVATMFAKFKNVVIEGRGGKVTEEDFAKIADGRILTARQALDVHLIDAIGYREDAVKEAKRLAGISDAAVVCYWRREGLSSLLMKARDLNGAASSPADALLRKMTGDCPGSPFLYLWPGP